MNRLPIYILITILFVQTIFLSFVCYNLHKRIIVLEKQIQTEHQYSPKDIARLKELFYKENQ